MTLVKKLANWNISLEIKSKCVKYSAKLDQNHQMCKRTLPNVTLYLTRPNINLSISHFIEDLKYRFCKYKYI